MDDLINFNQNPNNRINIDLEAHFPRNNNRLNNFEYYQQNENINNDTILLKINRRKQTFPLDRSRKNLGKPPDPKQLMKMVPSEQCLMPSKVEKDVIEINKVKTEDSLIDFTKLPVVKRSYNDVKWVAAILEHVHGLLSTQTSIAIHRSKLFALFDDFRNLSKSFDPNVNLKIPILKENCFAMIDIIEKLKKMVYCCSVSHWSQMAISFPSNSVYDSVKRIREDISDCITKFECKNTKKFIIPDDELNAQNKVDLYQIKGSLIEYLTRINDMENKTQQVIKIEHLIKERIRSIGPIEGLNENPAVVSIPPFLSSKFDLFIKNEDIKLGKLIGKGTFGCVYKGILLTNNKEVAIKVLNTKTLGGRQLETFKREVWTMANLNHPSILRLLGVTLTAPFCIVTELCSCSLFEKMKYLSPTKKSIIACKVSQAMEQLHSARIIHRDLKSANILLDKDDLPHVCDFGLVGFQNSETKTGFIGTAQWMAPEILRSSPFYDEKVDIYSFGVLLWELLTLSEPYKGMTQDQMVLNILEKGTRPEIPPNSGPSKLIELIKRCWSENPIDRPSFQQITNILYSPSTHFIGTNEEEFSRMTPHELLSSRIITAFDSCNWKLLDELIFEITPSKCEKDEKLIYTIISLFPHFDSERQKNIILFLPKMVDLQTFLCLKGYKFIVSLFSYTDIVIEAIVKTLRTLDISSKGFRQVQLLTALAHSKNESALKLCEELCQFQIIAKQITEHDLPFCYEGLATLYIYKRLLAFPELRTKISYCDQPLKIAISNIQTNPEEVCKCMVNYNFLMEQSDKIVMLNIIPKFIQATNVTKSALIILSKLFVACTIEQLNLYSSLISPLVDKYRDFFSEQNILLKLLSLRY